MAASLCPKPQGPGAPVQGAIFLETSSWTLLEAFSCDKALGRKVIPIWPLGRELCWGSTWGLAMTVLFQPPAKPKNSAKSPFYT